MEVSSAATGAARPKAAEASAFSENADRFQSLASTVLDTSGKFSETERLQAYDELFAMGTTGKLRGMDGENHKLFDQVIGKSDIAQRAQQIQQREVAAVTGAVARGESAAQSKLSFFDGLSSDDRRVHFTVNENATDRTGAKAHANIESYHAHLVANAQLDSFLREAEAKGADPAKDAQLASAVKLANTKVTDVASWTSQVLKLFDRPRDRIDLSIDAQKRVADADQRPNQGRPITYREGSILSTKA